MAEYQGKKVKLNDPVRNPPGSSKKFHVFVKGPNGKVKKVQFGDPDMEIKRDDPDRRKNFRARHNCDNPGPKDKARYWSCYQWRKGRKVDSHLDKMVDEFVKLADFTTARKGDIVHQFMKETNQKAVRIGDILYEISEDSGALTYYEPKNFGKAKDKTKQLDKWIEEKEKEWEEYKNRPSLEEEIEEHTRKAVDLMNKIVTDANGNQDVIQMIVDLSKLIDEQDFSSSFDMLKDIAKKAPKDIHPTIIELARIIASIRNDIRLSG